MCVLQSWCFVLKAPPLAVSIQSSVEAVSLCQLCGQCAGKLLTEGVCVCVRERGKEGEREGGGDESSTKFHSDPLSNLQTT